MAGGPQTSNIPVPEFYIENFQCLHQCNGVSFQEKSVIYFDATNCPTCTTYELEYGNPNFGLDPEQLRFIKTSHDSSGPEVFSLHKTTQCSVQFDSEGKHLDIKFKDCGREVENISCEGSCDNMRIYESWMTAGKQKLKYNSCGSFHMCHRYSIDKEFRINPDYGYKPGTPYSISLKDTSGDINLALEQMPLHRERSYQLVQLPVLDLKNRQEIQTSVEGTSIRFDLVTKDSINYGLMDPDGIILRVYCGLFVFGGMMLPVYKKIYNN